MFIFTQYTICRLAGARSSCQQHGPSGDLLVGGWSINSATVIGSGLPFTPGLNSCGPEIDVRSLQSGHRRLCQKRATFGQS